MRFIVKRYKDVGCDKAMEVAEVNATAGEWRRQSRMNVTAKRALASESGDQLRAYPCECVKRGKILVGEFRLFRAPNTDASRELVYQCCSAAIFAVWPQCPPGPRIRL
jgi:hypothetical protein